LQPARKDRTRPSADSPVTDRIRPRESKPTTTHHVWSRPSQKSRGRQRQASGARCVTPSPGRIPIEYTRALAHSFLYQSRTWLTDCPILLALPLLLRARRPVRVRPRIRFTRREATNQGAAARHENPKETDLEATATATNSGRVQGTKPQPAPVSDDGQQVETSKTAGRAQTHTPLKESKHATQTLVALLG